MNKNDLLFIFHSPHSAWGLRHRASKLPEGNAYRNLLDLLADLMDKRKITKSEARIIIEAARRGRWKDVLWALNAEYSVEELESKIFKGVKK